MQQRESADEQQKTDITTLCKLLGSLEREIKVPSEDHVLIQSNFMENIKLAKTENCLYLWKVDSAWEGAKRCLKLLEDEVRTLLGSPSSGMTATDLDSESKVSQPSFPKTLTLPLFSHGSSTSPFLFLSWPESPPFSFSYLPFSPSNPSSFYLSRSSSLRNSF